MSEDGARLVLVNTPRDPDPALFSQMAADHARIRGWATAIVRAAAAEVRRLAPEWNDGVALTVGQIAARLRVETVYLGPDGARVWLSDGGLFAGHAIEVSLDAGGGVTSASLAG